MRRKGWWVHVDHLHYNRRKGDTDMGSCCDEEGISPCVNPPPTRGRRSDDNSSGEYCICCGSCRRLFVAPATGPRGTKKGAKKK